MKRDEASLARFGRFLPNVAGAPALARGEPVTRQSATMFADVAGFTTLSERLAQFGTAGTEQVGEILRRVIGGALDIVTDLGGDALAFGGDAITVEFAGESASDDARSAAAKIVALFESVSGLNTLAGPMQLSVRIGIAAGRVTSALCVGASRHVLVQLGPGLDRAADASGQAERNGILVDSVLDSANAAGLSGGNHQPPSSSESVPQWAPATVHPLTASRIARGVEPPDEHRWVSTVFVSVPPVDDRDAGAIKGLADFVSAAADLIAGAGGEVVQCSGGDKGIVLYAIFGAPIAHPDSALRAIHAVDLLRVARAERFAVGISTGLAFTAVFGGESRGFVSAIGDTANIAARLMAAADPGDTLLDSHTVAAGESRLVVDQPRSLSVKNRDEPIEVVRFRELSRASRSFDGEGETPLVGREAELAAGERLLDAAAQSGGARAGGVLHIAGEAGRGKSRLAAEIARRAQIRGLWVRVGAFEAFGFSKPLGPFADFVRNRPGLPPIVTDDDLVAAIAAVRPGDENLAPLLGGLLGLDQRDTTATVGLSEGQRSELGRRLLVDLLCAPTFPTLLVVEDLHWADEASRQLLADLARRVPGRPLSLVTTRRPTYIPGCEPVLELADLPPDRLATIVRDTWSRLGGAELPQVFVDTLVERASGSPMFAQTVTELARRGYRPGVPLPEVPLPEELLPFLTSQIDTLGDSVQHTALRAAIFGRPVSAPELARVFGGPDDIFLDDLNRLVEAGIVRLIGNGESPQVALRHASVSEALVERASHAVRAPLHELVARDLIDTGASAREIASHLEHCQVPDLELSWFRSARHEASAVWALNEARHWAALALSAQPADASESDAFALAEIEQQLGNLDVAAKTLAGLEGAEAERLRGRIALETGRAADAVLHLERAELLGGSGAGVTWPLTMALCELARFSEAGERALRQLANAGADDGPTRLDALANLGVVEARQGDLETSNLRLLEARDLAAKLGDTMRLAIITGDLAGNAFRLGRVAEATELLGQSTSLGERLGSRRWVAITLANAAAVRLAAGERAGAERAAVASARASLDIGDVASALDSLHVPIDVAEVEGSLVNAARWWREHAALEERVGRSPDSVASLLRYASVQAALGDRETAQQVIERTEATAIELDGEDVSFELERAQAAVAGRYSPPPADEAQVDLPPLDASLPEATPAVVDALLHQIDVLLSHREALAG